MRPRALAVVGGTFEIGLRLLGSWLPLSIQSKIILPDEYLQSVQQFNPPAGIEAIIFDLENTLSLHGAYLPVEGVMDYIRELKEKGYNLRILTNKYPRLNSQAKQALISEVEGNIGVEVVRTEHYKPSRQCFRDALSSLEMKDPTKVAVVGDLLSTDIVGARRAGMYAVLVCPIDISQEPNYAKRFVRPLGEKYLRKHSTYPKNI